jgi:hypothetical protein
VGVVYPFFVKASVRVPIRFKSENVIYTIQFLKK